MLVPFPVRLASGQRVQERANVAVSWPREGGHEIYALDVWLHFNLLTSKVCIMRVRAVLLADSLNMRWCVDFVKNH